MTSWRAFDDEQIVAVERVPRSGRINYRTGEEGRAFDWEHAETCGAEYAVALANGTPALKIAVHLLQHRAAAVEAAADLMAQELRRSWH